MSIEVMKQVLEALERADKISGYPNNKKPITALRQAIKQAQKQDPSELDIWKVRALQAEAVIEKFMSQPEQEPVAWYDSKSGWTDFHFFKPVRKPSAPDAEWLPLYTSPPRQPGHIRMERTDESKSDVWWNEAARIKMPSPDLYKHGDTVLCWVNEGDYYMKSPPPPRQPEQAQKQEPVAWRYRMSVEDGHWVWNYATYIDAPKDPRCEPLYTSPPPRQPEKLGFAGVTVWIGNLTTTHVVTEMEIKHEKETGQAITHATQACLSKIAAHGIKE